MYVRIVQHTQTHARGIKHTQSTAEIPQKKIKTSSYTKLIARIEGCYN